MFIMAHYPTNSPRTINCDLQFDNSQWINRSLICHKVFCHDIIHITAIKFSLIATNKRIEVQMEKNKIHLRHLI